MPVVAATPPSAPAAPRSPKRPPVRRLAALAAVAALVALALLSPALRVAPASAYLLLAVLPGAPLGPLPALLGTPTPTAWSFRGAEGTVAADVYRPAGRGTHPTMLIVNGALADGRKYPALAQFGRALAQAGYTAIIPDYPDLLREELTPASLQDVEATLRQLPAIPGVDAGRVELIGFCVGGTLSLLSVEDPTQPPVRAVVDLAGFSSTADMLQVVTTDTYRYQGRLYPYPTDPWVVVAVARSVVAALPDSADRAVFAPFLVDPAPAHSVPPDWNTVPADRLSPAGRATLALFRNHDPTRVDGLIAALPAGMQAQLAALSPDMELPNLHVPVYIVADRSDTYIPNVESVKLADAKPAFVHLSYVSLISHTEPDLQAQSNPFTTGWDLGAGAWQLFHAFDQALAALA